MSTFTNIDRVKLDLVLAAHGLAGPLAQLDESESGEGEVNLPGGPELLIGELIMVSLLFSSTDNELAEREISLINELAQAVNGDEAEEINRTNFLPIFKKFVADCPGIKVTLDDVPLSIKRLKEFDAEYGTAHAEDAKLLFLDFASAIIKADGEVGEREKMALSNFESVLFPDE